MRALGATHMAEMENPTEKTEKAGARSRRILVVDDDVDAADNLAIKLKLRGHEVQVAYDGLSAVEAARVFCPEVAMLDIAMPDIDGYEVARRLRALAETKDSFLIAHTGFGQSKDRVSALVAGFDYHMAKPVEMEEVEMVLKTIASS